MKFTPTPIPQAYVIDLAPFHDERGFFARSWSRELMETHGLNPNVVQCNTSFSKTRGTIRGMHFQHAPYQESKLIRCTSGAIFDVVLDLRPESPAYKQWYGVDLTAENRRMLYIPEGCAHGFQTLTDDTEIFYMVTAAYHPESEGGVRWNDPMFNIAWPLPMTVISEKDRNLKDFTG